MHAAMHAAMHTAMQAGKARVIFMACSVLSCMLNFWILQWSVKRETCFANFSATLAMLPSLVMSELLGFLLAGVDQPQAD
eukprot:1143507-Pelagomonas_calceolata.AAC.1